MTVRIRLPAPLRTLAQVNGDIHVDLGPEPTISELFEALEASYPMLRGTIRDGTTLQRRPFVRFFACEEDFSHLPPDTALPLEVTRGEEAFVVLGAIAGGS